MFTLTQFNNGGDTIKLEFPEIAHATALYKVIENDRSSLSRWFLWIDKVISIEDEINNIEKARKNTLDSNSLVAIILVNDRAVGVIDLHNINQGNKRAEMGYWISKEVQGRGIVTESVKRFVNMAFNELKIHKLTIFAEVENKKSCAIAERAGFEYESKLKEHKFYDNQFKDVIIYSKFSD